MKRNLAILGSTGSIGTQALEVVSEHPDLFEVYALTANNQVDLLINQARKYMPEVVVIANEQKYPELVAALLEYNRQLYAEKQCNLTDLEACEEPAADLTVYGIEDEVIGVLEIPTMELTMPVYLGASDEHLAAGAAVLGNTSAPIGGDNTNCVIAGHRGWRGADYFRHIDRLQVGDTVQLTNLWETLTYTVTDIQIIQPHEVDKIKIQQDRDLLTLLTCHPYASGGRERYVVYCEKLPTMSQSR